MKQYFMDHQEEIARSKVFHYGYLWLALLKYAYAVFLKKDWYAAHAATLSYERIARNVPGWKPAGILTRRNATLIASLKTGAHNKMADLYALSPEAQQSREEFGRYDWEHQVRLKNPKKNDDPSRQGNLLVLKPPISDSEKGVLLIQYNYAFNKFVSLYDIRRVGERYRLVLEPSYWGYCDPAFLLFIAMGTEIVVQAQYAPDYDYIRSLHSNLIPLRLGAGDWIDPDSFQGRPAQEKIYDIVMVASWLRIKRHELFFSALKRCEDAVKKVALIGYPYEGRTKEHILSEAKRYGVADKLELFESIPRSQVSQIIGQSKIGLLLTLREGANKGIYECFFCDVPVIISNRNIGINRDHINPHTGLATKDEELHHAILSMLANLDRYAPRQWALQNTGYKNATRVLNNCLKEQALKNREPWTRDIYAKKNDTNARYVTDEDRVVIDQSIDQLRGLLRK